MELKSLRTSHKLRSQVQNNTINTMHGNQLVGGMPEAFWRNASGRTAVCPIILGHKEWLWVIRLFNKLYSLANIKS